ncbi:MAG: AmmeMemoRadiSam system radical SAM enzyme [Eubacteriales bacterium]|nr:AmmeMemoRadiSam system radical SAM enzyme [Eubacteriales bacterium]MDD4323332.1 AmmeMemoRadiSam system radical SAM enzyme [Eubacteriales bacterium]MDD4540641.1 AmmeMemoRadiSam system radical SAM enzyme [Eubacteriales bacterium]
MKEVNDKAQPRITCPVCPRHCRLKEGEIGFCCARQTKAGEVISISYNHITAFALDPIEKKPLSFFRPGEKILSVGSFGCNMNCYFCQNFDIARANKDSVPTRFIAPVELVGLALSLKDQGNCGIAFTYNEPLIGYEYVRDTAIIAREHDLETVVVTNGQLAAQFLDELLPLITAWNIDLKAFSEKAYRRLGGDFATSKETIERAAAHAHVEVTTLIVPGLSDDPGEMEEEAKFLAAIDRALPLHLSRYFPHYHSTEAATDVKLLHKLRDIAAKHLDHVILGNV